MGKRRKIRRFAAAVMFIVVGVAIPAYAEPILETGGYIYDMDSIKDYEGVITDEMMEEWQGGYDTENPTDLYGNELGWDMQGIGNEDEAGIETSADMMEAPTYSAKEQEEILESLQSVDEDETETAGKGWLRIKGNLGDGWPGYNITVAFYDNSFRRVEVTLYSQDDFVTKRELPVGRYKVYRAYVPGDENGSSYPLVVSDSSIEVERDKTAELTVRRVADISMKKAKTEPECREETEPEQSPDQDSVDIWGAAGISLVLLIFLISGIAFYRKVINRHRYG